MDGEALQSLKRFMADFEVLDIDRTQSKLEMLAFDIEHMQKETALTELSGGVNVMHPQMRNVLSSLYSELGHIWTARKETYYAMQCFRRALFYKSDHTFARVGAAALLHSQLELGQKWQHLVIKDACEILQPVLAKTLLQGETLQTPMANKQTPTQPHRSFTNAYFNEPLRQDVLLECGLDPALLGATTQTGGMAYTDSLALLMVVVVIVAGFFGTKWIAKGSGGSGGRGGSGGGKWVAKAQVPKQKKKKDKNHMKPRMWTKRAK
jgi:hypothetical protein